MKWTLPGESFSPLGVHSRDIRKTLLPLRFPKLTPVGGCTVQVRSFQRVELLCGEVQRGPE